MPNSWLNKKYSKDENTSPKMVFNKPAIKNLKPRLVLIRFKMPVSLGSFLFKIYSLSLYNDRPPLYVSMYRTDVFPQETYKQ